MSPKSRSGRTNQGETVWLTENTNAPRSIDIAIRESSKPEVSYDVDLVAEFDDGSGQYQCVVVECKRRPNGQPVTGEGIRALPIASMIRAGLEQAAVYVNPGTAEEASLAWLVEESVGADGHLDWVAEVYRVAFACGQPPTKGVAEAFGIPYSTAGKWVMRARKQGLIGPTSPGKAGERRSRSVK